MDVYKPIKYINKEIVYARARGMVAPTPKESEKAVEAHLAKIAKQAGGIAVKLANNGRAGIPDRLVLLPGGIAAFAELKSEGEKPRPLQAHWLARLARLGFPADVLDTCAKVDAFIDRLKQRQS